VTVAGVSADRPQHRGDCPVSVLVVEDDVAITTQLVRGLNLAGYETSSVATGGDALSWPASDVVLLDLGLPDIDGVEVCRQLRARSDGAIIVITARGEETDRVLALDQGADDYIIKPFGLAELLARIRAVLRRSRPQDTELLRHGDLVVDLRTGKVTVAGQRSGKGGDPPGDHGSGLGRTLVRPDEGPRRARRVTAQEARPA